MEIRTASQASLARFECYDSDVNLRMVILVQTRWEEETLRGKYSKNKPKYIDLMREGIEGIEYIKYIGHVGDT